MKRKSLLFMLLALSLGLVFTMCKKEESNQAPVVSGVVVSPGSINANGIASVAVTAIDPDGDALIYSYTVTGGSISGSGPNASWTAPSSAGAHSVTVNVSDGKGGTATGNGALTVQPAVTQVTGTAKFPIGVPANLAAAKVSLYTSYDNWLYNQPIKFGGVTGSGASVSFTISGISPGNYYLDVWSDNDFSGSWTSGDYVGWYGSGGLGSPALTEFQLAEGQTFNCTVDMYIY
ncbi:MAG: PKD domain-containing protein [Ignavibacteria bacterium]|nr:PKD domain-containing protein [Ignavibacteria bacterium]